MGRGSGETKLVQELILYAASAALSCLVLFVGLKQLDPNRDSAKKALEQKKEIAKRLGRPLIQTNSYEVSIFIFIFIFVLFYCFCCVSVTDVCFLLIPAHCVLVLWFVSVFGSHPSVVLRRIMNIYGSYSWN